MELMLVVVVPKKRDFVTALLIARFARLEDARNALNLNGQLEIAGRAIKPRCSAISIGGSSRKRGFSAVVGIPAVVDPVGAPSECLLLKNMFDPSTETEPEFDFDEHIKEDVKDECSKFGELNHIFVDKNSIGFLSTCHLKMRKQQWECNVLSMVDDYEAKFPERK
ncbi:RNA-binding protein 39-like [Brassica rapa]|uniref:RNA-binding protein 39-like n=1 Tax=Brassica campestris TaxID=3711 RepID=UPI00142D438B|nr:RNA-binding protein 39-like [Brassica rapa]